MKDSASISIIVVSPDDDHLAAINTTLRDSGHASHCTRVDALDELEKSIRTINPELIFSFSGFEGLSLKHVCQLRDTAGPHIPIIQVSDAVDEDAIATAMRRGARDTVSLTNIERLRAVAERELRAFRLENALENVMDSANQYKQELDSLKQISVEAIADIQEGIIVSANPAWLELFGQPADGDLTGYPIMDLCGADDQAALKGGLVACQRGKWQDDKLDVNGVRADGQEFPVSFSLENVEHDGEPAVRMLVAPTVSNDGGNPEQMIEKAIQRDQVTGFLNRQHFISKLSARLDEAPKGGVRALAYIRPDKFTKALKDIGLRGSESALSQMAQITREFTQPTDICGRFGGTMFTVMLERGTMTDVEAWAEQFLKSISDSLFEHDEKSTVITCSIGLCEVDSTDRAAVDFVEAAERACINARSQGGNRLELCETSGTAKQVRQDDSVWIPKIRGALMENRLRLEHQPVASLNDDIEGAYDTLVRMLDDEGNTILPGEFMPVAQRTGLVKNIDRWVIGASISFCVSNNAQLVFIRLAKDSLLDASLPEWLKSQTEEARIPAEKICFEIDEAVVGKHLRQTQALSETLRGMGFRFATEHFGKNEDSSRIIDHVPMDYIKVDGSLMQGLHKNPNVQSQIKELCQRALEKEILTIAERVQDANTMAILWQLGISHIQGNYVQSSEIVIEDTSQSTQTTLALTM